MFGNAKEKNNEIRLEVKVSDFIPLACHYDPATILTKNGELLQTIKIQSIAAGASSSGRDFSESIRELRQTVRSAIRESVKSDNFALWFHTVRTRQDISLPGKYPDILSDYINQKWRRKNALDHQFANEFYITVVHEGQAFPLKSPNEFLLALSFGSQRKNRDKYLKKAHIELSEVASGIIAGLKNYSARRLEVYEQNGLHYSEPLEFFDKIVNLSAGHMALDEYDSGQKLTENKISFGFNALEIENRGSKFATIFSVKEYSELPEKSLSDLFEMPVELVISETADFIPAAIGLKDYNRQRYMIALSQDSYFSEVSGLAEIMKSDTGNPTDFAEHQVTIMLIEENLARMEKAAAKFSAELAELGIVVVREDLMMENCFWSQLPGNFAFLRRRASIPASKLAALASVNNMPLGRKNTGRWGGASAIFLTPDRTPYFFNFYAGENGHCFIAGGKEKERRQLLGFLISESMKFRPRVFYFSRTNAPEIFLKGIGGKMYSLTSSPASLTLKMNPLLLPDSPENRLFLSEWLEFLLAPAGGAAVEDKPKLLELVAKIFAGGASPRKLSTIAALISESGLGQYAENFSVWHGGGKFAHIFDNDSDNVAWQAKVNGFNLAGIIGEGVGAAGEEAEAVFSAMMLYLLHRAKAALDGKPAFIVLDDLTEVLLPAAFPPLPRDWLEGMRDSNCTMVFTASAPKLPALSQNIANWFFLPTDEKLSENLDLTPEEMELLESLADSGNILVRQNGKITTLQFDISDLRDIAAMLSAETKQVKLMEKTILQMGEQPEKWLTALVKKVV